jgi:hypothetical protein
MRGANLEPQDIGQSFKFAAVNCADLPQSQIRFAPGRRENRKHLFPFAASDYYKLL